MALTPHISLGFKGDCEEAFNYYAQLLGGTVVGFVRYRGSPMEDQAPREWGAKVMHGSVKVGDLLIVGSDPPPARFVAPQGFELMLGMGDVAEAERLWAGLLEGATIVMPLQETFWALRFGVLVDRFGIRWSINCEADAAPVT
jgi:PhnB protein